MVRSYVLGNFIILLTLWKRPVLQKSATSKFIASFAIADLLVGIFMMPFNLVYDLTDGWPLHVSYLFISFPILLTFKILFNKF